MDNNGQLTFSDDPVLSGINEVYQRIEAGEFSAAVEKVDELLDIDPDYPGLVECYRTAKFWNNRASDIAALPQGKNIADFLMHEWEIFNEYALEKKMTDSAAFHAVMKYIFFKAADNYRVAFIQQQDTASNFEFLLKLGGCLIRVKDYKKAIETLEYARTSYTSNANLLAILGEAYFQTGDVSKSLLYFREAFFLDPSSIDLSLLNAKPIQDLIKLIEADNKEYAENKEIREWIPIYGFVHDYLYVRPIINKHQIELLEKEIYNLEINYQKLSHDQLLKTNILPRLINKYLWLLDYYEFQHYSFEHITQIRDRLLKLDRRTFQKYFEKKSAPPGSI